MNFHLRLPVHRAALAAASLIAIAGCATAVDTAAPAASVPKAEAKSVALRARVVQLIGDAACDSQYDCHPVGIDAKPCGGADTWLPWSTKVTDAHALQEAVQALMQASIDENKARGLASDCMRRPDPSAVCRPRASDGKKTCQLGQGGTASPV